MHAHPLMRLSSSANPVKLVCRTAAMVRCGVCTQHGMKQKYRMSCRMSRVPED